MGSEALPFPLIGWSTEQPQYPHRARTARAPRQVLPLMLTLKKLMLTVKRKT